MLKVGTLQFRFQLKLLLQETSSNSPYFHCLVEWQRIKRAKNHHHIDRCSSILQKLLSSHYENLTSRIRTFRSTNNISKLLSLYKSPSQQQLSNLYKILVSFVQGFVPDKASEQYIMCCCQQTVKKASKMYIMYF